METTVLAPVSLTESAAAELKNVWKNENLPEDYALRVGVKGGGCSGFEYVLGFDAVKDGDDMFETHGIRCVMNRAHGIYLMGMEVDYVNGLNNRGFTFSNPNAKSTCGCGTSFSA
jgi:iron-sulfur cluster assembly protein